MAFEICRIDPPSAQSLFQVFATMESLTTGRDFHSLKQEVKAICCSRRPPRSCVERAPRQRKSDHEHGRDTCVLLRKLTQLTLCLRVEIVGQVGPVEPLFQDLPALLKFP